MGIIGLDRARGDCTPVIAKAKSTEMCGKAWSAGGRREGRRVNSECAQTEWLDATQKSVRFL